MKSRQQYNGLRFRRCLPNRSLLWAAAAWALCAAAQGCAALASPVANGIPVRRVPPELLGESKEGSQTLPLSVLRQKQPVAYLLAPGDILGIWIEGILGEKGQSPPLQAIQTVNNNDLPPSLGYPIPVRPDGTISLPFVAPIRVMGMTLEQAQEAIRKTYTVTNQIILPGRERIIVTLQRPRQYSVLVIRQDAASGDQSSQGQAGLSSITHPVGFVIGAGAGGQQGTRRGQGFSISLPAYKNDVLNALAQTGGLPGTEAVNEIIIERGAFKGGEVRDDLGIGAGRNALPAVAPGTQRIRIPMRLRPGETFSIRPEDVILQNGDIVYIQAREADVFYTAGLLPAAEYILPRDTDLDVVEAIVRIGGSLNSGGLSTTNVGGTLLNGGFGNPSPSLVSIVRKTPEGGQVVIRVDLNRALRDRRERINLQPRDLVILQERPDEAITRYLSTQVNFSILSALFATSSSEGVVSGSFLNGTPIGATAP